MRVRSALPIPIQNAAPTHPPSHPQITCTCIPHPPPTSAIYKRHPNPNPNPTPAAPCMHRMQVWRENSNALPPFWEPRLGGPGGLSYVSSLTNFISPERPAPLQCVLGRLQ